MYFLCNFVHITHSDFVEILCSLAYTTHNVLCTFCVSLLTPPTAFWGVFRVGGLHHHQDFDDKDDDKDDKDDHDDDDDKNDHDDEDDDQQDDDRNDDKDDHVCYAYVICIFVTSTSLRKIREWAKLKCEK